MKKIRRSLAVILTAVMIMSLFTGCSKSSSNESSTTSESSSAAEESSKEEVSTAAEESSAETSETSQSTEGGEADSNDLPRDQTLYLGGMQWGTINSWNIIGSNQNNVACGYGRGLMFETLYMYNILNGDIIPLLADGDYSWNDDQTELTVKIKSAAHWSDGTPVTAQDVAATWDISTVVGNSIGNSYGGFIDSVEAVDDSTLLIHSKVDSSGVPINPLKVLDYLVFAPVAQKAWIETVKARDNNDPTAILNDAAEDVVYSGPYHKYYADDQKVVLIRDDNYWGQDASMWGSLPVPKYIAHTIYSDNAATEVAFKAGEVDVNQQFLPNIQDLWEKDGLPVSTWLDQAPYGVCLTMPTAWYNMNIPVLAENTALRKAIAIAVDYDTIIANAMTNQSPSFKDVPRSLMNTTDGEQALYNHDAVKDLQWTGNDIEGAKKLLDDAGIVDSDGDGWREWNGEKITLNAVCPNGWSDWQAAIEVVAAAGQKIGVDITTLYPESSVYYTVYSNPDETDYDIFMMSPSAAAPSCPWARADQFFGEEYIGMQNNFSGNYGQYKNDEADAIVKSIPTMTDEKEIKDAYTKLTEIYLTEVPSFSLMYRPSMFYAVNESVWTNYPSADDGRNIPPTDCTDGYGIRALYELETTDGQ
jgi:peptide/nickel transport system substrate-binding protein